MGEVPDGGFVTVDGFWSKAGLVASHMSVSTSDIQMANGVYDAALQTVGSINVAGNLPTEQANGKPVSVFGQYQDGVLIVERFDTALFMGSVPDLLLVEGFFSSPDANNEILLNGVARSTMDAERALDMKQLVRRCALRGRLDFSLKSLSDNEVATINSFCVSASPL